MYVMTLTELNEFTENFFNESKEQQEEHIEAFYELFLEMKEEGFVEDEIILAHIDMVINRAEEKEMFEISHIFLNVKNKLYGM